MKKLFINRNLLLFSQGQYKFQFFGLVFFILILLMYKTLISGDASIYFTFIKDFYDVPFQYGYEVKHGATSPLWVILHSLPFHILGFNNWLIFSNIISKILIFCSFWLLVQGLNLFHQPAKFLLILVFYVYSLNLFKYSFELYELPLSIFFVSSSIYLGLKNKFLYMAIALSLSVLCRPELSIWAFFMTILFAGRSFKLLFMMVLLGLLPIVAIYSYLGFSTDSYLPSSIVGRWQTAIEDQDLSYINKLLITIKSLAADPVLLVSYLAMPWLVVLDFKLKFFDKQTRTIIYSALPFLIIYIVFPPQGSINRYLMPLLPVYSIFIVFILYKLIRLEQQKILYLLLFLVAIIFPIHIDKSTKNSQKYDFDRLLGKDFSEIAKSVGITSNDQVAVYEIQFQFYTDAKLISLDGIVGGEALKFLAKKESFNDFIYNNKIKYIVTMSSFKYRKIFQKTTLETLLEHDLNQPVGSLLKINGIVYKKIITNPILLNETRHSIINGLAYHHQSDMKWGGHWLLWNSIYKLHY